MANRRPPRYVWRKKVVGEEWTPEGRVSDEELLNRVILAKALIANASGRSVLFRTGKEDLEITPQVARDVIRAAGQPSKTQKKNRKRK